MGRITDTVKILIIINIIVYAGSVFVGDVAYRLFSLYYFEHPDFQIWQPITHLFMHDRNGLMHIFFNMFGLYMFGAPLEERWGQKKFLFFYFSAGIGAAFIHSLVGYYQVHTAMDALLNALMCQMLMYYHHTTFYRAYNIFVLKLKCKPTTNRALLFKK